MCMLARLDQAADNPGCSASARRSITVAVGSSEPGKGTFERDLELVGGSGRYGNVRGHAKIHGQFAGKEISDEWSGTITGMGKQ
jgi:hypothetical protein